MSTTDKLHRELDKRGIRWFVTPRGSTSFTSPVLGRVFVWENALGRLVLDAGYASMTLEQVIEATLGAGTCEWCKDGKTFDGQTVMMTNHGWQKVRHCPNCGARIEVGDE